MYINIWSILVSAAVSFGIGALWYSPVLFGREWMILSKVSESKQVAPGPKIWASYLMQFVIMLVTFFVLAFFIAATGAQTASDGAVLAFIAWLGFVAAESAGFLMWEKKPWKLVVITSLGTLLSLVIGGAIIGAWR